MSSSQARSVSILVNPEEVGLRLDRLLVARLEDMSRTRVQALVRAGATKLGNRTIGDPGHRVKLGDLIVFEMPEPEDAEPKAQSIPLSIAYEDDHLIVIDKPAGLVVHPSSGHADGTLVNALLAHCRDSLSGIGGVRRPGIVHRLDKDTSGLLVVAKTDAAHRGLAAQFAAKGQEGGLSRRYLALVWGVPARPAGRIDVPLGRSNRNRTQIAVAHTGGRDAVTHFRVLETFMGADGAPVAALMSLELETGRTHQIRVHMQHIGHPVMADPVYATGYKTSEHRLTDATRAALKAMPGQALHAEALSFEHPADGRLVDLEAVVPKPFENLVKSMRSAGTRTAGKGATARPGRKRS
jgi:23S rRNA pseudouridine1911/1915/1917 synthase